MDRAKHASKLLSLKKLRPDWISSQLVSCLFLLPFLCLYSSHPLFILIGCHFLRVSFHSIINGLVHKSCFHIFRNERKRGFAYYYENAAQNNQVCPVITAAFQTTADNLKYRVSPGGDQLVNTE